MRLSSFPSSYRHSPNKFLVPSLLSPLPTASKPAVPSFSSFTRPTWAQMDYSTTTTSSRRYCRNDYHQQQQKQEKIVVIMGPTGSGKSRLSIDLATRFFPSEIINSDKMQVYSGLDITTNKIPMHERLGVPHHLLGDVDPSDDRELSPSEFRSIAASTISGIASRRKLPLIVGGSNSFIYALLAKRFDPDTDVFHESHPDPVCTELRYDCCFLWVDVSISVLNQYLIKRVDEMFDSGMFDELGEYFDSEEYYDSNSATRTGLRKAIGLPEFEPYFRRFPSRGGRTIGTDPKEDPVRRVVYEEAVRAIKDNTCQLAKRQVEKIQRLRSAGWDLQRLDATEAFMAAMAPGRSETAGRSSDVWERQVAEPSIKIVKRFLEEKRMRRIPSFHFCTMKRPHPLFLSISK